MAGGGAGTLAGSGTPGAEISDAGAAGLETFVSIVLFRTFGPAAILKLLAFAVTEPLGPVNASLTVRPAESVSAT